jgi:hypothetical protein
MMADFGVEVVRHITALERDSGRLSEDERPPWQRGCRVYRSTAQSISHNTLTAISFNAEVADTDGCWASGAPTRLYARHAGYYLAGGQMHMTLSSVAADVMIAVREGGSNYFGQQALYASASHEVALCVATGMFWMDVDDYVEIVVRQIQASGSAAVNVTQASAAYQQFNNGWLMRVA